MNPQLEDYLLGTKRAVEIKTFALGRTVGLSEIRNIPGAA